MDCADVEKALLAGRVPEGARADAHFAECPSCRFLRDEGTQVARALAGSQPLGPAPDLAVLADRVAADVQRDTGVVGALRALPRAARLGLVVAVVALEVLFFFELMRRGDFDVYPSGRMFAILAIYAALAVSAAWIALRPLYLPPGPAWAPRALLAAGVLAPIVVALLPEVPTTAIKPGYSIVVLAFKCFSHGGALAVVLILVARALDRGGHAGTMSAGLAAVAGGIAGVLALQVECPNNYSVHLLTGHATLPVGMVVIYSLFRRL